MRKIRGQYLEIDEPSAEELEWIYESLQLPEIYAPLSLGARPARDQFERGELYLIEGEGDGVEAVRYYVARLLETGNAWGFFIEYGWEGAFDTTREFDLAIPHSTKHSIGLLLEAHVVGAQYLFVNGLAKRLRWRVKGPKGRAPRWYGRLGARHIGEMTEPHPISGEPLSKHVYELSLAEFRALFSRNGLDPEVDYGSSDKPIWDLLRRK